MALSQQKKRCKKKAEVYNNHCDCEVQKSCVEGKEAPEIVFKGKSSLEVKNAILHAFDGVISDFTTLECDQSGHNLFQAEQILDSGVALQRRFSLPMCSV